MMHIQHISKCIFENVFKYAKRFNKLNLILNKNLFFNHFHENVIYNKQTLLFSAERFGNSELTSIISHNYLVHFRNTYRA